MQIYEDGDQLVYLNDSILLDFPVNDWVSSFITLVPTFAEHILRNVCINLGVVDILVPHVVDNEKIIVLDVEKELLLVLVDLEAN